MPELLQRGVQVCPVFLVFPGEVVGASRRRPSRRRRCACAPPGSKQYVLLDGLASAGVGSPSSPQRSMKRSCAAEHSFSAEARHLAMTRAVTVGFQSRFVAEPISLQRREQWTRVRGRVARPPSPSFRRSGVDGQFHQPVLLRRRRSSRISVSSGVQARSTVLSGNRVARATNA